jgi:hypothetical protein
VNDKTSAGTEVAVGKKRKGTDLTAAVTYRDKDAARLIDGCVAKGAGGGLEIERRKRRIARVD